MNTENNGNQKSPGLSAREFGKLVGLDNMQLNGFRERGNIIGTQRGVYWYYDPDNEINKKFIEDKRTLETRIKEGWLWARDFYELMDITDKYSHAMRKAGTIVGEEILGKWIYNPDDPINKERLITRQKPEELLKKGYLPTSEFSTITGLSKTYLDKLVGDGKAAAVKVRGNYLFDPKNKVNKRLVRKFKKVKRLLEKGCLVTEDLAKLLNISPKTVPYYIHDNKIVGVKVGNRLYFNLENEVNKQFIKTFKKREFHPIAKIENRDDYWSITELSKVMRLCEAYLNQKRIDKELVGVKSSEGWLFSKDNEVNQKFVEPYALLLVGEFWSEHDFNVLGTGNRAVRQKARQKGYLEGIKVNGRYSKWYYSKGSEKNIEFFLKYNPKYKRYDPRESSYGVKDNILHPAFGGGVVTKIDREKKSMVIKFDGKEVKFVYNRKDYPVNSLNLK